MGVYVCVGGCLKVSHRRVKMRLLLLWGLDFRRHLIPGRCGKNWHLGPERGRKIEVPVGFRGQAAGGDSVAAGGRAGQGRPRHRKVRQVTHPGRQLAAAFPLGSQRVAVNHHPLDFELAKDIKGTLIRV